ncbi:MAG TPA: bifunctional DNA-formamidopyrimidine glycosylase/DNA-(apurinic or apyrimidinic site) lyase [Candidatus Methanoperedens sp.]|nr:bifunctional DNA-formamidopyrimidine glycosylase/DNA-(apurinic or apyrimidinic site) lyase [Candidatus Methanoperedens sp.]
MPELPEVEVVKLFLEQKLLHKTITKLEVLTPKSFIGKPELVEGQKIVKFSRIGKQLSIYLSNQLILLVHLKMTGQLIYDGYVLGHPTKDALANLPNKSTRLIFHLKNTSLRGGDSNKNTSLRGGNPTKQSLLYFNDQRKFGWIKLLTQVELVGSQSNLGLDIFDPNFSPKYIFNQLSKSRRPVKVVLLDQHFFAGIGNIYANDALFLSGIHPITPSNKISLKQAKLIYKFMVEIMQQSVLAGGSTARDNKYLRPDGTKGENQFFFRVYEKKGEPCLKCGTKIKYTKLAGRGTFFCPNCQKL